ncbi:nitroreductase family protein [Brevibacterium sp.]|uniref:nitroreductase family protein n=1 Tax=Brevibacterium sp. TaxID=1701 RepID=UPI0028119205|nr:nitroreductase family protein [Brevibacterium sp.]
MSKHKKKSCAKDAKHKDSEQESKKHESKQRERARALFLNGETGPWAKKLAEAHDEAVQNQDAQAAPTNCAPTNCGPDYSAPTSIDLVADPVLHAISTRRSISKVGPETPNDSDLREIIRAISSVADHKGLCPWRFLIIRGDDRLRLGAALDEAAGEHRKPGQVNEKPLRAELLLALVSSPQPNPKVPDWEQHATAAGAGHLLELALWQAGWGVMWRSGTLANAPAVRRLHRLSENELLMGWFYIGSVPEAYRARLARSTRPLPDPEQFLDTL